MSSDGIKEKLRQGKPVFVPTVWTVPHWKIVEMIGVIGFDGIWIEMEHSDFTFEQISQMTLAARTTGMEAIVRVSKGGYNDIIRPLEAGATGLIYPHCTGAAEAVEFVRMARFHPLGWRGIGGSVDTRYGTVPFSEYIKDEDSTLLFVMIERKEAVGEIEGIAATEGLDGMFIGPYDLSQSYGIPGQVEHPLIREAIDRVAKACAQHGKWWGMPLNSIDHARQLYSMGARFFNVTSEMSVLMAGFKRAKEEFDTLTLQT